MRHFATEKFKAFLLAGTFSAVVGCLGRFIHSVIAGHVIGEERYLALLSGSEYVEMYGRQCLDWMWPVGFTKCFFRKVKTRK